MCNDDLVKYLKSFDFVSEAQEFRIASLDGFVSLPVVCFYRSCKGSSNKGKLYDRQTEKLIQSCKKLYFELIQGYYLKKVFFVATAKLLGTLQLTY